MHNRVRVEPEDEPAVERLARYIMRPPISLERMHWSGGDEVLYRPKGGHDGRARQPDEADIGAAPPDGRHVPSASAARDQSHDARALRRSWAQLIKRVYEVDPLLCPSCGGEMRVIAFIIDHDVVDAILRHLVKAVARSPRGPPGAPPLAVVS